MSHTYKNGDHVIRSGRSTYGYPLADLGEGVVVGTTEVAVRVTWNDDRSTFWTSPKLIARSETKDTER